MSAEHMDVLAGLYVSATSFATVRCVTVGRGEAIL